MLGITVVAIGFIAIMLVFYFHIRWLVWLLNQIKFLKKFHRFFDIMGKYKAAELLYIMWFLPGPFLCFYLSILSRYTFTHPPNTCCSHYAAHVRLFLRSVGRYRRLIF